MKLIKRIVFVLCVVALLFVGFVLGQKNPSSVAFDLAIFRLPEMPLGVLVCVALLVGFALGALVAGVRTFALRMKLNRLERKLVRLAASSSNSNTGQVAHHSTTR